MIDPPVARDDVEPAVAVEVARGNALPQAGERIEARVISQLCELPALIVEQAQRSPLAGENEVGKAVTVEVAPDRAIDKARIREGARVLGVDGPTAVDLAEYARVGGCRILAGHDLAASKEVEVAITVDVRERQRARRMSGQSRLHFSQEKS
jgi:hypothetical protein